MDILSILALNKANKALKNSGGGTVESSIVYYDFTCEYDHGYYVVTTDATVPAILDDISNGKLPIAIIHRESEWDELAYIKYCDEHHIEFLTPPDITDQATYAWHLQWDTHDKAWDFSQVPPPIE